jgi:glycosyltransferase involved in cell wall biosynthesis
MKEYKVAYIEGRPSGHPTHTAYAQSLHSTFHYVDHKLRYHDIPEASSLRRYLSWVISAFTFPKRKTYDIFFSEEAYFMLGFMKKMGLISKKQKLIALMASHTLYFLHTNQYSVSTKKAFLHLFKLYDAFICIGPVQFELLSNFIGDNKKIKIYQTFNGVSEKRFKELIRIRTDLSKMNIITIGAITNQNRVHYKGIDLMLEAFAIVKNSVPGLTFTIIGQYDPIIMKKLMEEKCPAFKNDVILVGQHNDPGEYLKNSCLYLHTARGEAWGISVVEAMAAGVPPVVSEWTGSKEAVGKVTNELIVPLEVNLISEKIKWYLNLSLSEKERLSKKCKEISELYTENKAIESFKYIFNKACTELNQK